MKPISLFMTKIHKILPGFLVFAFCFGCQQEILEPDGNDVVVSSRFKSTETKDLLVITKSETLPSGFENEVAAFGKVVRSIPEIGVVVVKPTVSNAETKIAKHLKVQAVVPDIVVRWIEPDEFSTEANPPSIGDNEPFFGYQWNMDAIDAPEAWNAGYTGQNARIFVLDAGIDADNPDLAPNLNTALCASFVPEEDYNVRAGSFFNHGTHVAGIIAAADNSWGVIGVAPYAEIVAVKVLSEYSGSGAFSGINAGIVYAANNGADVINMSLGATFNRNGFYMDDEGVVQKMPAAALQNLILAQQRAVNYAFRKGVVIVSSAGNGGSNFDGNGSIFKIPAELQNVLAVSATAPDCWILTTNPLFDIIASYSDYGKSLVDLAAPGGDFDCDAGYPFDMILSTCAGGPVSYPFYFSAGTSMAAPHVAGVAALIIGKNGGEMDPNEVTKQLFKTADKIDGNGTSAYFGNGRVNAFRAVTE
ncbi:MAG: S8 family serine peptidase [Bacteroidales bacterium]|nr:S8 family serine peptidase [Bacteroidales bacterium]